MTTSADHWSIATADGEDGTEPALVARPCIISLGRIIGSFDRLADAQRAVAAVNAQYTLVGVWPNSGGVLPDGTTNTPAIDFEAEPVERPADDSLDAACPNCGVRPSDYDRDAQYAERPADAPDLIDRAAAIAAVDREGGRLPDVGYKTGITSAMRVLEGVPAERADDDSLDAALRKAVERFVPDFRKWSHGEADETILDSFDDVEAALAALTAALRGEKK